MNITDIIEAFSKASRLDYNSLADRLSLPTGKRAAASFARKLKKFNLRAKPARIDGKVVRAYERSHFEQVAKTKQPYWEFEITV